MSKRLVLANGGDSWCAHPGTPRAFNLKLDLWGNCLNENLRSTQPRWRAALTIDEFYSFLQIGIVALAFVALVLTFAYLAYEKS